MSLLNLLGCPTCRSTLDLDSDDRGWIESGSLKCNSCRRVYPIRAGIPRFVNSDDYLSNFGMEWTVHARTAFDSHIGEPASEYMFKTRVGFQPEQLRGSILLDAGCGSGRLIEIARMYGATVVGLDYTIAIETAAKNLWPDANVHLVQGDILAPPFREEVFDLVFSNGVVHHTPSPPSAFSKLSRLVKRGGEISVWVYPDEGILGRIPNRAAALYRLLAKRLPLQALYKICSELQGNIVLPQVLYEDFFSTEKSFKKGHKSPRQAIYVLFPFWSMAPYKEWRIMDTFDFLSAKHKFAYSYDQVRSWFRKNGMVQVDNLPFPVAVKGRRA